MPTLTTPTLNTLVQSYERHQSRIVAIVTLLLTVMVGLQAAKLVWTLMPTPASARWQPPPSVAASNADANPSSVLNTIVEAHLFGSYSAVATSDLSAAPETRLDLKLIGILAGTHKNESRAIIARQGVPEAAYALGDDIVNGVTLHAIFPDRVVLSHNGQMETLRLDPTLSGVSSSSDTSPPTAFPNALPQQLAQARQEMLQDPSKSADYVRIQPNNNGGQMHGYRIYPGRNPVVFNNAGLKPGDLVTAVNGVPLDDTQKGLQMLNDLSKAGSFSLSIDRGGQSQTINMSFN